MKIIPIKRALLSVSNKSGIVNFAKNLMDLGIEIISTGGTSHVLNEAGITHSKVEDVTGFPEVLEGRVKTLHPKIHGGILGRRDRHEPDAKAHDLRWIDLVVVNFYPFADAKGTWEEVIEYIDIGGPAMARAAAKNFAWVGVVVDPADYHNVIAELKTTRSLSFETRENLAAKTFSLTSAYDAQVSDYFMEIRQEKHGEAAELNLQLKKQLELRYGENPHQRAFAYQFKNMPSGILTAKQLQGKQLSFNNILDLEAAINTLAEFAEPACVIVKHANPCGVAIGETVLSAYQKAYACDSLSAFGAVIALNQACDGETAESILQQFVEVLIAPDFTEDAKLLLATKPNIRVLILPNVDSDGYEMRFITGGILLQEKDKQRLSRNDLQVVTQQEPTDAALDAMLFAWRVVKHLKSNAIVIAEGDRTIGIGAGAVSRVDAVETAIRKASLKAKGAVAASDAFFPFRDSIDRLAQAGIKAIIQPGGSVRDQEVIDACQENGIAMVFTGMRCFKH